MKEYFTFDDVLLRPKYSDIDTRQDIELSTDFGEFTIELPIISANMDYITELDMAKAMWQNGAFYSLHRFYDSEKIWADQVTAIKKSGTPISFSVGVRNPEFEEQRVKFIHKLAMDADYLPWVFIDVAHGHHSKVIDMIRRIRRIAGGEILIAAGNVATAEGFSALASAGADAVKVGIGPGSVCTTRTVAGVGVPQLSAIMECYEVSQTLANPPYIIADGGLRSSGDIVKALAAGADLVMLGYLLAGTAETPSPTVRIGDVVHKKYRGQSTIGINFSRETPEGVEGFVRASGTVSEALAALAAGIRSGCSYVGARNLTDLKHKAEFIKVSPHTLVENQTRVVIV